MCYQFLWVPGGGCPAVVRLLAPPPQLHSQLTLVDNTSPATPTHPLCPPKVTAAPFATIACVCVGVLYLVAGVQGFHACPSPLLLSHSLMWQHKHRSNCGKNERHGYAAMVHWKVKIFLGIPNLNLRHTETLFQTRNIALLRNNTRSAFTKNICMYIMVYFCQDNI